MAYDARQGVVVLFGGSAQSSSPSGALQDTWTWNGVTWTQRHPATAPPARSGACLVYDAARGELVLFGGGDGQGHLFTDTWTWDGATWTEQHPANTPTPRAFTSMAYDAAHQQVVLFGGEAPSGAHVGTPLDDTWTWNGTTWTEEHPASAPSPRYGASMAYDDAQRQVVLFGGTGTSGAPTDTWTWDGSTWTQRHPTAAPSARAYASMVFDAATQQTYLFAGTGMDGTDLTDAWTWDGTSWARLQTPRYDPSGPYVLAAYDERQRVVVAYVAMPQAAVSKRQSVRPGSGMGPRGLRGPDAATHPREQEHARAPKRPVSSLRLAPARGS